MTQIGRVVSDENGSSDQDDWVQLVGFRLADQEYAFRIEQIQEIVVVSQLTRLPQVATYVEGVSNLRGTIIPVINLRLLFGLEYAAPSDDTRIIVVNVGSRIMGCIVDSVTQVMKVPRESIQAPPSLVQPDDCAYVSGLAKLDRTISQP